MKTLGQVLKLSTQFLEEKGVSQARRLSEGLLAHLLSYKRMELYMQFDQPLVEKELETLRELLKRAATGEPLEYITAQVDFFGCSFTVDKRVLIPRVETELIVDRIAKEMKDQKTLWDVCTGSGCIGISLKNKFPSMEVTLSDLSQDALSLAKENALKNKVDVDLLQGDLLEPFTGKKAEIVVCNPPYISSKEMLDLDISVRNFEPSLALEGGSDGLSVYKRLAQVVHTFLEPGGQLWLEIGHTQGDAVEEIFESPLWKRVQRIQDLSGKDRFFFLENQ